MTAAPLNPAVIPARRRATLIGACAILLWSSLALLTDLIGPVPPFQLVAVSFGIGGVAGLMVQGFRRRPLTAAWRQPIRAWLLGIGGLFGYHALYFLALQTAPAVEANLINYLWPLLIVVFSGLLPGERLGWPALAGAALGLGGTLLLVTGGQSLTVSAQFLPGYLAAFACAVVWAGYSVLSRRQAAVPTEAVTGFCLGTALLALLCHGLFESTVWPQGWHLLLLPAMGLGPVGLAFFVWDYGVKHGDLPTLGALSYATPLLSTGLLILAGRAEPTETVLQAGLLIVAGAVLAGRSLVKKQD